MSANRCFALLCALLLLAGCSSSDDDSTPTDPTPNEPTTYTVTYDGNGADGGTAPVDTTSYGEGEVVNVASDIGTLTFTDHTWDSWNTASDGSGTEYGAGGSFTMGAADVTLYAQWTENSTGGWEPASGSWDYVGDAGLSEGTVDYCRLVLDSMDRPVAAYSLASPAEGEPKQRLMRWNGSSFVSEGGSPALAGILQQWFDIACDPNDGVWFSTTDASNNGVAVHFDGSAWQDPMWLTLDQYTFRTSIAINDDGNPLAAFRSRPDETEILGILEWTGSTWIETTDGPYETRMDNNTDIEIIDGAPWVMYADALQNAFVIRANGDGSGWETVGGESIYASNGVNSMVLTTGPEGRPWVAFRQHGDVHLQYWDGGAWVEFDTEDLESTVSTSGVTETLDLVFVGDVPVVAFVSVDSYPKGIRVEAYHGGGWVRLADVSTVAPLGSHYPQLAVAGDGRIFLGYQDENAGDAMSVKVYTPAP